MAETISDEELREQAEEIVETKITFRQHVMTYISVNAFLFVIWLVIALISGAWFPWFLIILVAWGIGLGIHWLTVTGRNRYIGDRDVMVEEELQKMKSGAGPGS